MLDINMLNIIPSPCTCREFLARIGNECVVPPWASLNWNYFQHGPEFQPDPNIDNLLAMETLLPWQQSKLCNNSALCEYLSRYKAHMFFCGTKCVTGLPGCYGNHCNHGDKELCTNSTT